MGARMAEEPVCDACGIMPFVNTAKSDKEWELPFLMRVGLKIRSVLQGVECYWLSILPIPAGRHGGPRQKLDPEQAQILIHPVTEEEIKKGFCCGCYGILSSGHILRQINHSVLALIPKSKDSDRVEDYRPLLAAMLLQSYIQNYCLEVAPALTSLLTQPAAYFNRKMIDNIIYCGALKARRPYLDCIDYGKAKSLWRMLRPATNMVAASRLTIAQFSPLMDKISDYISAWTGASLSYAGRTELIRSVLQGVECYWLSILPIPAGVRKKITQRCRNFLWSGRATINKKPLVDWKEVTLPRHEKGLGIRNSKAWNKALISKTLWDIQAKKDSLWVQWIHYVYMSRISFWEYKNKHEDSPLLKQIIALRDEIIEVEGSMQNAIICLTKWAPDGYLRSSFAYEFFRPKRAKNTWSKLVWHRAITPKYSFILWLGLKDCLLTRDKLHDFLLKIWPARYAWPKMKTLITYFSAVELGNRFGKQSKDG
ncbi:hypothetical protein Acr_05g0005780 [Actinidia rufa]|uniref:Reverse transcriptase zinc-binding domain-containing protein n=1 Tax=Actinidia rufa TaxID=165716 RepID=A0A7J0ELU6_9ERIC|nr:hypothetical protein Acr_05g0005780 [Actinidia rufa]